MKKPSPRELWRDGMLTVTFDPATDHFVFDFFGVAPNYVLSRQEANTLGAVLYAATQLRG